MRAPGRSRLRRPPAATWRAVASASLYTATDRIPIAFSVADHPDGDLTPVGNQNRVEGHHTHIRKTP